MNRGGMHRKTRTSYNTPGEAHELTFSCFGRRAFLGQDRTRGYVIEAIEKARFKHGFHLWGYVIMPEHVHLLFWPPTTVYAVGAVLLSIKQSVARRALIHLRKHDPSGLRWLTTGQKHTPYRFWMDGGGYDRNMTTLNALRGSLDYIHANPVKRGLVAYPEDWPWSSAGEWVKGKPGILKVDRESFPAF